METMSHFKKRVQRATGKEFVSLPKLTEFPEIGGKIFCRRGSLHIVAVGYPDIDEDNNESWTEFARVQL